MAAIKEGGVTQNESLLPKFLHKTGSSRSKQSERNSGKYPCFELQ